MRIICGVILLCLASCGFKPMLATENYNHNSLKNIKIVSINSEENLRIKRTIEDFFSSSSHYASLYDLKINMSHNVVSMGIMTDNQITRYRVNVTLDYTLLDGESKKILDSSSMSLRSSYDSENSDFANFIAERTVEDNILKQLLEELKTRLILVISELEQNGKNSP